MVDRNANTASNPRGPSSFHAAVRRAGVASWSVLGVVLLAAVAAVALTAVSGILVPLLIAIVLGMVLEPLPNALRGVGVPSSAAAALTLAGAIAAGAGTIAIVAVGFVQQWPEIYRQLELGWESLATWAVDLDIDPRWLDHARSAFDEHASELGQGVLGVVTSTFYGAVSLVMGTFFAIFFLFFTLRDARRFPVWLTHNASWDVAEVDTVVSLIRQSVRGYFRGTAITAVITAPIFMVPLLLLGVPLAIPILILYFVLSFIPYLGAWITGVFAVMVALGSSGPTAAAILGVCFVVSNGTIQSVVSSWALGASLRLHPVAVLLATIIGGTVAGLLGMVLGAPVLAATVKSVTAVRGLRSSARGDNRP